MQRGRPELSSFSREYTACGEGGVKSRCAHCNSDTELLTLKHFQSTRLGEGRGHGKECVRFGYAFNNVDSSGQPLQCRAFGRQY